MALNKEQQKWIDFFKKMSRGEIPHTENGYYVIDDHMPEYKNQLGGANPKITLVSPSQAQVEQAKLELKRQLQNRYPPVKKQKLGNKPKPRQKKPQKPKKKKPAKKIGKPKTTPRKKSTKARSKF